MVCFPVRRVVVLFLLLAVALSPAFGCRALTTTVAYFLWGTDVEPDFKDLKDKTVAVVCRPLVSLQYRNANVGKDLAQKISLLLEKNLKKKIKLVDQRKVAKWTDENTWEEYSEVGKAMKADMVVGVDLETFSLYQGQTLYQGKANATVRVYDCKKGGKVVYEKTLPQSVYPPNSAVATSERTEPEFRAEFVAVLANQIARHFYSHDAFDDVGQDAAALR